MSNFNTELYKALASGSSIDEIVRSEIESCVNFLLKTELTSFLDYEPYDTAGYNTGNSRNGYYARTITTRYGDIEVQVPRDRNGEFKQQTIRPYKRNTDNLETTILQLYSKGITISEISDLIEKMYGHAYTPATISNMTKAVYQCKTSEEANKALDDFIETYKDKYPKIQDRFENRDSLFSWLSFPKDIQCSLYTSNLIEGLNKQLKRKIKQKEQFPNEASLEHFVCTYFMEYNQQFSNRIHRGFNKVQKELVDMFDQRYK